MHYICVILTENSLFQFIISSQYTKMFLVMQLFPLQLKVSLELGISDTDIILLHVWVLLQMDR